MIQTISSPKVVNVNMLDLLVKIGATTSKSKARRLIEQGAVEINREKVGLETLICDGDILQCGKHFWRKLRNTDSITLDIQDFTSASREEEEIWLRENGAHLSEEDIQRILSEDWD